MMNNSDEMERFCENVRAIRRREGLSKTAMAKRLHISTQSLTRIENGEIPPRLDCFVILMLCREFGEAAYDLFR